VKRSASLGTAPAQVLAAGHAPNSALRYLLATARPASWGLGTVTDTKHFYEHKGSWCCVYACLYRVLVNACLVRPTVVVLHLTCLSLPLRCLHPNGIPLLLTSAAHMR